MESAEPNITNKNKEVQRLLNLEIYSVLKKKASKFEFFFELCIRILIKRSAVSIYSIFLWNRKKKDFRLSNPLSNLRVKIMDYP